MATILLVAMLAGPAPADPACERWRQAFASMPEGRIHVESGARRLSFTAKLANTPERQAGGFQCATPEEIERTLILFDFGGEIHTSFHMQNVPAALDIAFVKGDGRIFSILLMAPSETALYAPLGRFRWALEAPTGFFARHAIRQGDARLTVGR